MNQEKALVRLRRAPCRSEAGGLRLRFDTEIGEQLLIRRDRPR